MHRKLGQKLICCLLSVLMVMPLMAMAKYEDRSDLLFDNWDEFIFEEMSSKEAMPEGPVADFVSRLYTVVLNRDAEETGLTYWTENLLAQNATGGALASTFLNSDEFTARNLSNEDYLKVLYRLFFNRSAEEDASGFAYWLNKLNVASRDKVLEAFINSAEWKTLCESYGINPGEYVPVVTPTPTETPTPTGTNTPTPTPAPLYFGEGAEGLVNRLYYYCLGREADESGRNYWVNKLTSGQFTGKKLAREFFYSLEFIDKSESFTTEEIIDIYYLVFFDRFSEEAGVEFWTNVLTASETGYDDVFNGFADSVEFYVVCRSYGIESGYTGYVPGSDPAFENWVRNESRGISRLNAETNRTPRRTYLAINAQGSTSTTRTVTISAGDWAACEKFAQEHFSPYWTNGEKVAYTMYWINRNVTYIRGDGWNAISGLGYAEAIFNRRLGQCAQYNGALTMMMCYLGYDCALIQGYRCSNNGNTFQHFWNETYINGTTYVNEAGNYGDSGSWHFLCCVYGEATKFVKNGRRMD